MDSAVGGLDQRFNCPTTLHYVFVISGLSRTGLGTRKISGMREDVLMLQVCMYVYRDLALISVGVAFVSASRSSHAY